MKMKPHSSVNRIKKIASQRSRNALLRDMLHYQTDSAVKRAALGGEQESGFEESFASLAYTYIQDKAPGLLDYMIGFQLVDRTEDNEKAIGIFGFQVDKQWIYVPVFFLGGKLKGHEMMYLKEQDRFVPLKENWVNYVLNKKPHILGEASPESMQNLGVLSPNIRSLSEHPSSKYSQIRPELQDWAKEAMPLFASWGRDTTAVSRIENFATGTKTAGYQPLIPDLSTFLEHDVNLIKCAMDMCRRYPGIKAALAKHYGDDLFVTSLTKIRDGIQKSQKSASSIFNKRGSALKTVRTGILGKRAAADTPGNVKVITEQTVTDNLGELSGDEKATVARDGYLVRDSRKGDEVSVSYNTQIVMELTNPTETGLYEVLTDQGKFEKCLVINNPHKSSGRGDNVTVIRLSSPKNHCNSHKSAIFVKPFSEDKPGEEAWRDWFKGQSSTDKLQVGDTYIVVTGSNDGTYPFTVDSAGDDRYEVDWDSYGRGRPGYLPSVSRGGYCCDTPEYSGNDDIIIFNKREGTRFKSIAGALYVPADAKVIKVKDAPKCSKCTKTQEDCDCEYFRRKYDRDRDPIGLGNLADLQMQIMQKVAFDEKWSELKIFHDNQEVIINQQRMSKFAGLCQLISREGFRKSSAVHMLKEAEKFGGSRYYVKKAEPYLTGDGPMAPPQPAQEYSQQDEYGGVPTQGQQTDFQEVPGMSGQNTDPSTYDPMANMEPDSNQVAQQASQEGQKEVFDTAMVSAMLKAVRGDSLVDRFLGDLMKALDSLGRILFMFYWHNEEFMDRYGKQDLPELEDTIRNAFEVLGDLCLFLKQKTIEPSGGSEIGEPELAKTSF
jgi:hypothetical protein